MLATLALCSALLGFFLSLPLLAHGLGLLPLNDVPAERQWTEPGADSAPIALGDSR